MVKPEKAEVRNEAERRKWWLHARAAPDMRAALATVPRFLATSIVAKHRLWVWRPVIVLASHAVCVAARADDTTFGILHSRFHELWSLRMGTSLEDRPRYTPTTCFETFPFPAGLTPRDTAYQRTETVGGGAVIPADLSTQDSGSNRPLAPVKYEQEATKSVAKSANSTHHEAGSGGVPGADLCAFGTMRPPAVHPSQQGASCHATKTHAIQIAKAAKRLNDLRNNWLNPPEWTDRVPEVTPLGMDKSPYPDRILPKLRFEKELAERTLTKLYNQRPAWLDAAHKALDLAVAHAYGWADYTQDMPDEEILKRLLALNLARAAHGA